MSFLSDIVFAYLKRAYFSVDGAIHTAAGPKLLEECMENNWMLDIEKSDYYLPALSGRLLNGCRTGQSKITRGYDLPAFVLLALFYDIVILIRSP